MENQQGISGKGSWLQKDNEKDVTMNKTLYTILIVLTILLSGCGVGSSPQTKNKSLTTELEGTWYSGCTNIDDGKFSKGTIKFTDNNYDFTFDQYSDSNCSILIAGNHTEIESGTFVIGEAVKNNASANSKKINFTNLPSNEIEYDIFTILDGELYFGLYTEDLDGSAPDKRPIDLEINILFTKSAPPVKSTSVLQGVWFNNCKNNGDGTFEDGKLTFFKDTFNYEYSLYSDESCDTLDESDSISGTFVIAEDVVTESGQAAKKIQLTTQGANDISYDIFSIIDGNLFFGLETDEKDGSTQATRPVELDFSEVFNQNGPVNLSSALEGTWMSNCVDLGDGTYAEVSYNISGNTYAEDYTIYVDASCSTKDSSGVSTGIIVLGETITTEDGKAAQQITFVDQTSQSLDYDVFGIINGELFLGLNTDELDGSTPEQRPVDLEYDLVFTKVVIDIQTNDLQGTWASNCLDFGGVFGTDTITFTNNIYVRTIREGYTDADCSTLDQFSGTLMMTGTFTLGSQITTDLANNATEIDMNNQTFGITEFEIVSIINSKLYLGLATIDKDKSTIDRRPSALDFDISFQKTAN